MGSVAGDLRPPGRVRIASLAVGQMDQDQSKNPRRESNRSPSELRQRVEGIGEDGKVLEQSPRQTGEALYFSRFRKIPKRECYVRY